MDSFHSSAFILSEFDTILEDSKVLLKILGRVKNTIEKAWILSLMIPSYPMCLEHVSQP